MPTPNQETYDYVYLSPHLDDAILSCGGQIYQQTEAGKRVLVVTIAAGEPETSRRSNFAQFLHHNWGLSADEVVAARRAEDVAACRAVGADYAHWTLPDCIYRVDPVQGTPLYTSDADIFGEVDRAEQPLIARLAREMSMLPPARQILAPLTLGNHVDHQLTRAAAERQFGPALRYYEDYPYIQRHPETLPTVVSPKQVWQAQVVPLTEQALAARIEASSRYRSQIGQLFNTEAEMAQAIRRQVAETGGERLWRRRPEPDEGDE